MSKFTFQQLQGLEKLESKHRTKTVYLIVIIIIIKIIKIIKRIIRRIIKDRINLNIKRNIIIQNQERDLNPKIIRLTIRKIINLKKLIIIKNIRESKLIIKIEEIKDL